MMAAKPTIELPILNKEIPAIAYLASRNQWVCWDYEWKGGEKEWTKPPIQPNGIKASSTNQQTWSNLDTVFQAAYQKQAGIGYVLNGDIVFIDLDGCRNKVTGVTDGWAAEVIKRFNSFTEISPSGTGFHILCKGKLPEGVDGKKSGAREIYTRGRYMTVTGVLHNGSPEAIEERQEAIDWFLGTFPDKQKAGAALSGVKRCDFPHDKFDALMINEDKFRATWLHKRSDLRDQSLSTYDMALCVRAALNGWNDEELASLIYQHRMKWQDASGKAERQDYIDRTVSYARSGTTQHTDGGEKVERAEATAVARAAADDVAQEGPEASLQELRARLGIPVKRSIITGIDKALAYSMELDDGRMIEIGTIAALLDQRRFRGAVAETTKEVLPLSKQPVWDGTVKVFLAAAEHVEPGDEDPREAVTAAIGRYVDAKKPCEWDGDNADAIFLAERPIYYSDGELLISMMLFFQWLQTKGYPWKIDDVRRHMKGCGWRHRKVGRRIDGRSKTQNRWSSRFPVSAAFPQEIQ